MWLIELTHCDVFYRVHLMLQPPICQSIEVGHALLVDTHVRKWIRLFVYPVHGNKIEIATALNRLHQHVNTVFHVDEEHPLRVVRVRELYARIRVVVRVDEATKHIQTVQLMIDVKSGGVGIVPKAVNFVLYAGEHSNEIRQ